MKQLLSSTLPLSSMARYLKYLELLTVSVLDMSFFYTESPCALQGWESRGKTFFLVTGF